MPPRQNKSNVALLALIFVLLLVSLLQYVHLPDGIRLGLPAIVIGLAGLLFFSALGVVMLRLKNQSKQSRLALIIILTLLAALVIPSVIWFRFITDSHM